MKNLLKPILVVGVILTIFLTAIVQSNAAPGLARSVNTTVVPRITATLPPPTKTPYSLPSTPTGNRPPACTFPLASLGSQESAIASSPALENFSFSEPKVALSSPYGISLVSWLPDNETLLVKRRQPDSVKETIETFNTRTGQSQIYAVQDGSSIPVWLPDLNAVAYTTSVRKSGNSSDVDHYELWISYGSPDKQHLISADVSLHSAALLGQKLIYFSPSMGARPQIWDDAIEHTQITPINLESFVYSKFPQSPVSTLAFTKNVQIAPHPQGRWSAFYGSALLFLADSKTGQVCEIDLGTDNTLPRWAYDLQWSADGRYLTMLVSSGYPGNLIPHNNIVVLDTLTGKSHSMDINTTFVYQTDWLPNSRILSGLINIETLNGRPYMGLVLMDATEKNIQRILPEQVFGGGAANLLAWSTNAGQIAIKCPLWATTKPLIVEDRICIVDVTQQP